MTRSTSKAAAGAVTQNEEAVSSEATVEGGGQVGAPVSRDEALKTSYAEATKTLRANHLNEFNGIRKGVMKSLGFEWAPAPTAEEQAKATIDQLIADNPGLADLYRKVKQAEDQPEEVPQDAAEGA